MDPLKLLKSFNEVTERFELIRKNIMDNPKNIVIAKNMARKMGLSKIDIDDICKRLGGNPNEDIILLGTLKTSFSTDLT